MPPIWISASGERVIRYLIRNNLTNNTRAHYWNGHDTACRLYSSGSIKPNKYRISNTDLGCKICVMCAAREIKTKDSQ